MTAQVASKYEEFTIESNDGSRTVDLKLGVVGFSYYEDIFSPTITATVTIITTGDAIKDFKGKQGQKSVLNGLPVVGGERVKIKIKAPIGKGLDWSSKPENYLYVAGVSDVSTESGRESFTLKLVSRAAITNETSRVNKKYATTEKIDASAEKIAKDFLKIKLKKKDETKNKYGFIGNMRKPFTVLTWLASKAIPSFDKNDSSAGYVFYQTHDGFFFRSLDALAKEKPFTEYKVDEVNQTTSADDVKKSAKKIIDYHVNRNTNVIEKMRTGAYATNNIFFDPLTFEFPQYSYKLEEHLKDLKGMESLMGEMPKLPPIEAGGDSVGNYPTRVMSRILDRGTLDKDVKKDLNSNPVKNQAQSVMRYNLLMTQSVSVTVPCNTDLRAGMMIKCFFPNLSPDKGTEYDEHISGLYMIKELGHHFDTDSSYTSMLLVRDTYGRKK